MRNRALTFLILVACQVLICNYLHLSMYLSLSILPVLIICLPTKITTPVAMIIAFAAGFVVDYTAEGVLGLNSLALVPVALLRRSVCDAVFGEELVARKEDFSVAKFGWPKVAFAVSIAQALFLLIYIWADGGQARPFGFNLLRGFVSFAVGIIISVPIADKLTKYHGQSA